jgi:hypothetical protein
MEDCKMKNGMLKRGVVSTVRVKIMQLDSGFVTERQKVS